MTHPLDFLFGKFTGDVWEEVLDGMSDNERLAEEVNRLTSNALDYSTERTVDAGGCETRIVEPDIEAAVDALVDAIREIVKYLQAQEPEP